MAGAKLNRWVGIGRVAGDPEKGPGRGEEGGERSVFSVAVDRAGEGVDFVDVVAFGKLGETCNRFLKKGRQVYVEGRLQKRSWEKDGQKRSRWEVNAYGVQFLDGQKKRDDGGSDSAEDDDAWPDD